MLSLDHHLSNLHRDLANMEAMRGHDYEPGQHAEAAALFIQEGLIPDRIPIGHGGPRSD